MQERRSSGQHQTAACRPFDFGLESLDLRRRGVLHHRHAVRTEIKELKVVPVLEEYGSVPAQPVPVPLRLPPQLVILELIGLVGWKDRLDLRVVNAIDAAGAEPRRVSRIHHSILIELVVHREALAMTAAVDALVEVRARSEMERLVVGLTSRAARRAADILAR